MDLLEIGSWYLGGLDADFALKKILLFGFENDI